ARVGCKAQGLIDGERGLRQPLLRLRGDRSGGYLLRSAGLVLVLVVVEALERPNLNAGQGAAVQETYLYLAPGYVALDHDGAALCTGAGQGLQQLLPRARYLDAYAGAGVHGLHDA